MAPELNCLLVVSPYVVTGSGGSLMFGYHLYDSMFRILQSNHKDAVRCLVTLPNALFASGSIDGSIGIWDAQNLVQLLNLNATEVYADHGIYLYSINVLLTFENFLVAAVYNSFHIYELPKFNQLCAAENAHSCAITTIAYCSATLYPDTTFLITASEDAEIKVWHFSHSRKKGDTMLLQLIDQPALQGHSGAIHTVAQIFLDRVIASCSSDKFVILWKDGDYQREFRNNLAAVHVADRETNMATNG
eukprot:TRINITY_DN4843_c0_g1_i4.p1 TRINITY_DN4843_c0_g1~~TRINITY_DN4843_c0_g1_i4.p1  ORF type:complete len:247 (-),score=51.66 TRINITY_DN4843_c0_g1_i4:107-847(-)